MRADLLVLGSRGLGMIKRYGITQHASFAVITLTDRDLSVDCCGAGHCWAA
jgi:hypothetical protein